MQEIELGKLGPAGAADSDSAARRCWAGRTGRVVAGSGCRMGQRHPVFRHGTLVWIRRVGSAARGVYAGPARTGGDRDQVRDSAGASSGLEAMWRKVDRTQGAGDTAGERGPGAEAERQPIQRKPVYGSGAAARASKRACASSGPIAWTFLFLHAAPSQRSGAGRSAGSDGAG